MLGFAPAGVRKGYYVETNEDAMIMWAHDVDQAEYQARPSTTLEQSIPGHHDRGQPRMTVVFAVVRSMPSGRRWG